MIPTERLARWLGDTEAREGTRLCSAAASKRIDALEPLRDFRQAIAGEERPEQVEGAIQTLFADTGWVFEMLADQLADAARDPFFTPPWRAIGSDLHYGALLVNTPVAALALNVAPLRKLAARKRMTDGTGSVNFSSRTILLKILKAGGMRFSLWRAPPVDDTFRAADAGRCERTGERMLLDGDLLRFDTATESYIIEGAEGSAVWLQGEIDRPNAPVAREYDAVSRRLVASSSADDRASRAQLMLTCLRQAGRVDASAVLRITAAMRRSSCAGMPCVNG